jgi:polar amino acid transport system substrate-binding protein
MRWNATLQCALIACCLFVLLLSPNSAGALTIYTVDEPPGNYISTSGELVGISVDMVKELQRRVGDTSRLVIMPEKRTLEEAAWRDDLLFFSFSRTDERENAFQWLMPLYRKAWNFYVLKAFSRNSYTLDTLRGMRIGAKIGDVREDFLRNNGFRKVESVTSHASNIRKLELGRIDAMVYDSVGMAFDCRQLGLSFANYRAVYEIGYSDVYVLFSRAVDENLVAQWRKAGKEMMSDGPYEKIALKWAKLLSEQYGIPSTMENGLLIFN